MITEIADLVLRYKAHSERVVFAVTRLGKEKLILGMGWLCKHNPEVDWATGAVRMTQCPAGCSTCRDEIRAERASAKRIAKMVSQLREGPVPHICAVDAGVPEDEDDETGLSPEVSSELPDLTPDSEDNCDDDDPNDFPLEEGDRILYTCFTPPENIRATETVSQRLAEAFAKNSVLPGPTVLEWAREFLDVFNKESFDNLPEHRSWDHAIELVPDSKPTNCKVCHISPLKQKELDAFIEEGLATGRI